MATDSEVKNPVMVTTNREDEDDLEALRLAALLSRKSAQERSNGQAPTIPSIGKSTSLPFKKKQFPGQFQQENHRNNFSQSNKWSRQRSSNLIVINPVPLEEVKTEVSKEPLPKLILPQDKWCPPTPPVANQKVLPDSSGPGKFSRIRCQSDDSETDESESEADDSESEEPERKLGSDCSTSDELTAEAENDSSSDFLVMQEHDSLDDIDGQTERQNENHSVAPNATNSVVDDSNSPSSTESDSDVDENEENVSKVCSATGKNERSSDNVRKERKTDAIRTRHASQRQVPSKKPLDLREVLKAKRDVKNNSDYDTDDDRTDTPVLSSLKSVLSVVKRSTTESNDLNKKLSMRHSEDRTKTKTKDRTGGRSVFLTLDQPNKRTDKVSSDGMQVTVVTGSTQEKKCSVHMRLGVKKSSGSAAKAKVPVTSRLGVASVALQQSREPEAERLPTENFVRDQSRSRSRRRRRRSRSATGSKRSRNSGFRGSKESEREAKIRRIEKINTVRR